MRFLPIMLFCLLPSLASAADWTLSHGRVNADAPELGTQLTLQRTDLDQVREELAIHWGRRLDPRWTLQSDLRIEQRHGFEAVGATIGSTGGNARAALLQAPIDHTTREWNIGTTFNGQRTVFRAGLMLANFSNGHEAFRWQNPFPAVAGWAPGVGAPDGIGQLAREPDNSASQIAVGWAWRNPGGMHLNLDASIGRHRQNQAFLPYTINPALAVTQPLPRASLDGRVARERFGARMRWPMAPNLDLDMRWRDVRNRDRTPPALFVMLRGDAVNQPTGTDTSVARWRLPRSDHRAQLEGSLNWRFGHRDRLRWTWSEERIERSYSEVGETVERTHGLEWRRTGARHAHLRIQTGERQAGVYRDNLPFLTTRTEEYLATVAPNLQFENHPLLRRFNMADRRRDTWQGGVGWSGDTMHLGLMVNHRSDRYEDSVFGLTTSGQLGWHADFGMTTGENTHLTLWLAQERWRSAQDGRHFRGGGSLAGDLNNPDRNWTARTLDRARLAGVSWRHRAPWTGGEFSIDLSESRNTTDVAVSTGPAITSAPLPTVNTRIRRMSVAASHQFSASWRARLAFDHEQWRSRDWAYDGVTDTTVASVLGIGDGLPNQGFGWVSLSIEWRP